MLLKDFLRTHLATKENKLPITNTRIGKRSEVSTDQIFGGSYSISDEEYPQFLEIYYNNVFVQKNPEYLTEKQLENGGPILIDIDFRYNFSVENRIHTKDHIDDFIALYLDKLKEIYDFNDIPFYIFVMEKPNVNRVDHAENPITKDGIHIIIGIQADRNIQLYMRDFVVKKVAEMWQDLPIINPSGWDGVFDQGISAGYVNWQLYGSGKPDNETYRLTHIYKNLLDPADNQIMSNPIDLKKFNISQKIELLSARCSKHPKYNLSANFKQMNELNNGSNSSSIMNAAGKKKNVIIVPGITFYSGQANGVLESIQHVKNHAELDAVLQTTLDQLNNRDYELVETHNYTMTLPEKYYGPGSYDKWIRVGWALANTCNLLFVSWVVFSAQSPSFSFTDISEMYEKWQRFESNNIGLSRRSLMHWSKQDAPMKFKEVRSKSVDFYIDKTLDGMQDEFNEGKKGGNGKACGEHDIANVLKQLYKDEFVCVSIKNNIWYHFHNHRWMEIDSGTTLRKAISVELREIYYQKMYNIEASLSVIQDADETDDRIKKMKKKMNRICEIGIRLASTNDKKNIMTEAKELFHDPLFMDKLDTNPYLLCFNNGVVDFKEGIFRKGYPEDYLSKCTLIDYVPLDTSKDKKVIDEITDFMEKLFPKPELRTYMWDHLASVLLGTPDKQTFNMYTGDGRNGKSVLTTLMDEIMGEYKGVVPLSAITQDRTKIGGTAAELAELKGVRYAVIMEPSKKDAILEGPLKQLTSGLDPIQCRAPYSMRTMTYYPQFKLVLCSNVMMEVKTQDFGTWRRIRVVPFESLFTENPVHDDPDKPYQFLVDGTIVDKFSYWKYTFMAMLVERAFKTKGAVKDCDMVMKASREYQESQDFIAEFIKDKIVSDPNGKIKKSELNSEFTVWFMNTYGKGAPSPKEVHSYMDKKFGKFEKKGAWVGARIKYERDEIPGFVATDRDANEFDDGIEDSDL